MPYDFGHESKVCANELFYRNGSVPEDIHMADAEYVAETIKRYLQEAYAADRQATPSEPANRDDAQEAESQ